MTDTLVRPARADAIDGERVIAKVSWRLVPLLMAGFFIAYLDRVNIGFAALTMNKEMGFSPQFFGWAAGVFFIGYFFFEAPSNYVMHRIGARLWLARIMVSWGLIAAATAFVWSENSFVALRLLLGAAEAGFAPGVILYLTYWIPAAQRARVLSGFLIAVPLGSAIGSPISGIIMTLMDGVAGFSGWRWLYFVEALPSIALGVVCFFYLPDRPADAAWLTTAERDWLETALAREEPAHHENFWRALVDAKVLLLGRGLFRRGHGALRAELLAAADHQGLRREHSGGGLSHRHPLFCRRHGDGAVEPQPRPPRRRRPSYGRSLRRRRGRAGGGGLCALASPLDDRADRRGRRLRLRAADLLDPLHAHARPR